MGAHDVTHPTYYGEWSVTGLIPALARIQAAIARMLAALLYGPRRVRQAIPPLPGLRSIVVIRVDELGDVVLSTAFLRELRRAAPQARITLVVQPSVASLLREAPFVDTIVSYDTSCSRSLRPFILPIRSFLLGIRHLRALHADLAILPRWDADQVYATMLTRFSGARFSLGYSNHVSTYKRTINAGFDGLLSHVLDDRIPKHEIQRGMDLLRWLGATPQSDRPELFWNEETEREVDALLHGATEGMEDDDRRWVALCPSFGHSALKQWPTEHFISLARMLDARGDVRLLLTGAPADRALASPIAEALGGRLLDLTGCTTLPQLAAMLARCTAFVGADTGSMHIASAVGTPTIGILGPTNVIRFAPWRQDTVTLDFWCSPANRNPSEDRCRTCVYDTVRCMTELSPELVYQVLARRLDAPSDRTMPARQSGIEDGMHGRADQ